MSGRVVHFEIPYDDVERARAFYAETFGWELTSVPGMDYTMVACGPGSAQGGPPTEPGYINGGMAPREQPGRGPTVVIDVDDIDQTLAEVEAKGGSTVLARTAVGEMGFSAYFTDTEGNVIGLWQDPVS